jgi:ribosomal-protein-alanine N-acetyltransferase
VTESETLPLFIIRSMTTADAPIVFQIADESGLSFWSVDDYTNEVEREDSIDLAAVLDNLIIGFIIMRFVSTNEAEIYNIAVNANARKSGCGSLLLSSAVSRALQNSALKTVWLEVRESNTAALEFYKKHGFQISGHRKNFYTQPTENAVLMKLEVVRA